MSEFLSMMSGFGQAAITVATLSFAVVFATTTIGDKQVKEKLMGVSIRIRRFTWSSLIVVLAWVVGTLLYSCLGTIYPDIVKAIINLIVVFQALGTLVYSAVLLLFISELLKIITPKSTKND